MLVAELTQFFVAAYAGSSSFFLVCLVDLLFVLSHQVDSLVQRSAHLGEGGVEVDDPSGVRVEFHFEIAAHVEIVLSLVPTDFHKTVQA